MSNEDFFNVQPLVTTHTSTDNRYDFLQTPFPHPPFRLLVIGSSGSGKTLFIMNLVARWLLNPDGTSIFKKIFLFTPSLLIDPSFQYLAHHREFGDPNKVYASNILETDLINDIINRGYDDEQVLVWLDDFASSKKDLQNKILYDLYFRSRHNNISVIFTSQYFFQVPIQIRQNANYLALFALTGDRDLQLVRQELATARFHDKKFDEAMRLALEGNIHNFLWIDRNTGKFYKCLNKEITIE